jgi:hypothetical protein
VCARVCMLSVAYIAHPDPDPNHDGCRAIELADGGWYGAQRPSDTPWRAVRHGKVDGRLMAALEAFQEAGAALHPLEAVRARCEELLDALTTTAEEDVELLDTQGATPITVLLLRYRLGKKVVLMTLVELCKRALLETEAEDGSFL